MDPMKVHFVFDALALLCSMAMTIFVYRWRLAMAVQKIERAGMGYIIALLCGAAVGGFGFGSLNLWLSGNPIIGRSIVGSLAGGIFAIELYKFMKGMKGSTGIVFVPAFATTVAIGRWGCHFAGLSDETHGIASTLPWAVNQGDGVLRHPVALYESFAMLGFLIFALWQLARRTAFFEANGFYIMVLFYAVQRFMWEFLKPYAAVLGPLNVFQLVCIGLSCYSLLMLRRGHERANS
jgi:phosphatidylglycerol---prolipoprotein diacylglyceryl transferase